MAPLRLKKPWSAALISFANVNGKQLSGSPRTISTSSLPPLRSRSHCRVLSQRRNWSPCSQIPSQLPRHHFNNPQRRIPLTNGLDRSQMVLLVRSLLVHGSLPRISRRYAPLLLFVSTRQKTAPANVQLCSPLHNLKLNNRRRLPSQNPCTCRRRLQHRCPIWNFSWHRHHGRCGFQRDERIGHSE